MECRFCESPAAIACFSKISQKQPGRKIAGLAEIGAEFCEYLDFAVCYNTDMILRKIFWAGGALLLAALAPAANAVQPGDDAAAKANHCVGCHDIPGYRSVFPDVYPVPKIIGQSAPYIEKALRDYRSGVRTHPSMTGIAVQLSDEDIKLLAEWYANGAGE